MFIDKLIKQDKLLEFQCSRVLSNLSDFENKLYEYIDNYLLEYCEFHNLDEDLILKSRSKFILEYTNDLKNFTETGLYPFELKKSKFYLSRIEYDLVLILSFLSELYRFKIASWLASQKYKGNFLIIGCGPGVELGIIKEFCGLNNADFMIHDTEPSFFVQKKFGLKIKAEYFNKLLYPKERFENIILIEILEHLYEPFKFLEDIQCVLKKDNFIYLTTANNIPQFDHLYNFKIGEIKKSLKNLSFDIKTYEIVKHLYLFSEVDASNELIMATKNHT